jgi:hypothetical protein
MVSPLELLGACAGGSAEGRDPKNIRTMNRTAKDEIMK